MCFQADLIQVCLEHSLLLRWAAVLGHMYQPVMCYHYYFNVKSILLDCIGAFVRDAIEICQISESVVVQRQRIAATTPAIHLRGFAGGWLAARSQSMGLVAGCYPA